MEGSTCVNDMLYCTIIRKNGKIEACFDDDVVSYETVKEAIQDIKEDVEIEYDEFDGIPSIENMVINTYRSIFDLQFKPFVIENQLKKFSKQCWQNKNLCYTNNVSWNATYIFSWKRYVSYETRTKHNSKTCKENGFNE